MCNKLERAIEYIVVKHTMSTRQSLEFKEHVKIILSSPEIISHADPDVMAKAGWVKEKQAHQIEICPYCLDKDCTSDHK